MNVHIQRVFFERITFSPNPIEHLLAREHAAGRFEKLPENLEFLWSQLDGTAVDQDFMTIKVHPQIARGIPDVRLDAGCSASKDGAHPRDPLANTLTPPAQINPLIIFLETLVIVAGEVSLLHGDDGNPAQLAHSPQISDGPGSTVKNNQGRYVRVRFSEGNRLRGHCDAAIPTRF